MSFRFSVLRSELRPVHRRCFVFGKIEPGKKFDPLPQQLHQNHNQRNNQYCVSGFSTKIKLVSRKPHNEQHHRNYPDHKFLSVSDYLNFFRFWAMQEFEFFESAMRLHRHRVFCFPSNQSHFFKRQILNIPHSHHLLIFFRKPLN